MSSEGMIRCPHCGKFHPKETIYCPENGMPIYQAENEPAPVQPPRRTLNIWIIASAAIGVAALCIGAVVAIFLLRSRAANVPPTLTPVSIIIATVFQPTPLPAPTLTSPPATEAASATATIESTSGPWDACVGAVYLSRLHVGDKATVSSDPPQANRVRSEPSIDGAILGYIQPGEEITILEGPGCSSNWVWWRMRSIQTNLEGWTAEGDQNGYWLVPVVP